jgi:hypothetical protein
MDIRLYIVYEGWTSSSSTYETVPISTSLELQIIFKFILMMINCTVILDLYKI